MSTDSTPIPGDIPPRATGPGWAIPVLGVLTAVSLVAAVVVPTLLPAAASDRGADAVQRAVTDYLSSGRSPLTPQLAGLVAGWRDFLAVKAALGGLALLLAVTVMRLAWRGRSSRAGRTRARRAALSTATVGAAVLSLLALLVVMASVQGVVAPLSSTLSRMPTGPQQTPTTISTAVVPQLTEFPHRASPPVRALVHDFAVYHVAMVAIAAVVSASLLGLAGATWRRSRRIGPGRPAWLRLVRPLSLASVVLCGLAGLLCAANVSVALRPAPALLAFFQQGAGAL